MLELVKETSKFPFPGLPETETVSIATQRVSIVACNHLILSWYSNGRNRFDIFGLDSPVVLGGEVEIFVHAYVYVLFTGHETVIQALLLGLYHYLIGH